MLSKKNRLAGYQIIPLVLKGNHYSSPLFNLKHLPSDSDIFQAGFVVSKKVFKNAVARNKLKRTLRSIVKQNQNLIPLGHTFLFLTKPAIKFYSKSEVKSEIIKAFKQIKNPHEKNNPRSH